MKCRRCDMHTIERRLDQLKSTFEFSNKGELKRKIVEQVREIVSLHEELARTQRECNEELSRSNFHDECMRKENNDLRQALHAALKELEQRDADVSLLLDHAETRAIKVRRGERSVN
jgi:predicted RNase H-like nuclease (RuvC/YqgF family)